ncbi:hypothetical protein [Dickeya phage JA15]|uniref:Uncharacterized protein n=10 Tax=Limestonevirus limestone TaxID=1091052 RepID=A0A7L4YI04_9CAUD|nr:hypothetical protein [Dickeya phage JA15]ASD51546.1 hypothetical protein [Dickeya phage XF4]ATW62168.1 hypothetical protein [Dickeya phage PP35]AYN55747.1 hypothetical protein [Dickeya phage Kamild]QHB41672.1 hypothetical protein [Dickeya phage Ds5CZ]QHB41874.1 hypothetical protein [Dickeya phage Ds9CZ]QHB42078.1 hypothetical protein [Dickeya phage Ds16CZ]QHB42281.1 hypothetical protein [Dickeya phage Ds20CZ]QHB42476.1 hypothetical protein [Dickeya phage Ds23CZ]QHB42907.1 hypothetical p
MKTKKLVLKQKTGMTAFPVIKHMQTTNVCPTCGRRDNDGGPMCMKTFCDGGN